MQVFDFVYIIFHDVQITIECVSKDECYGLLNMNILILILILHRLF